MKLPTIRDFACRVRGIAFAAPQGTSRGYFTSETVDARDKVRKNYRYSDMATPRGRLKSQPVAAGFLKPGVSFEQLDRQAAAMTDVEAVTRMNEAQAAIFDRILQQLAGA